MSASFQALCNEGISFSLHQFIRGHISVCQLLQTFAKTEKEKHLVVEKVYSTKRKNNTFNTSSVEELFEKYLHSKQYEYIRQYKDENRYPFLCDFYIPKYDLFIEIQGNWTHGKHPFNNTNKKDIEILNIWKSKNTTYYEKAIYDWTQRDVLKRNIAKENNLNYLEIFSYKIDVVIKEFNEYLKRVRLTLTLSQPTQELIF